MDLKEIQSVDMSVTTGYASPPQTAQKIFEYYEFQQMAKTTFAGVFRQMNLKPGEEWKVLGAANKGSIEAVLAEMDEIGVQYAMFLDIQIWSLRHHTLMGRDPGVIDEIGEFIKKGKGRIIGGAGYNPFRIQESIEEIERAVKEYGFKYVWFHPISFGLRPDDRKCYPLYMKCVELGIPVGFQVGHSAEPLTSEPGHPMCADQVFIDFPELTGILTHTGYPWIDEWCSMLWRHEKCYGAINAYFPSGLDPATVRFMDSPRGRDKIVSGSHGFGMTRFKKEFLELPVSDKTKQKVLRDNAMKIFNLK
ncbi:MAG: amidohydrolase family protein [Pseudomonadota bacterium]